MLTRNERLADHYIAQTGIAGFFIEQRKLIFKAGICPAITVAAPPARRNVFCVPRARHAAQIADALAGILPNVTDWRGAGAAAAAIASDLGIGLTPHQAVAARACAVVLEVNERFDAMRRTYQLKAINRQFKALRAAGSGITYADFTHEKKADMLTAMAQLLQK